MNKFTERVRGVVAAIPRGKVMSYGEVALRAGNPRAARAVGAIMNANRDTKAVPCHRIIRSDGSLGGYNSGTKQKMRRLRGEGVKWDASGKVYTMYKITE